MDGRPAAGTAVASVSHLSVRVAERCSSCRRREGCGRQARGTGAGCVRLGPTALQHCCARSAGTAVMPWVQRVQDFSLANELPRPCV
eukprot:3381868-Pleurochrysis_carterae.AAC.1